MAMQLINNGETGLTIRTKINQNFAELAGPKGAPAAFTSRTLTPDDDSDVLVTTIDSIGEATVTGLQPTQAVVPVQTVAAKAMQLLAERTNDPTLPPRTVSVDLDVEFGTTCGCVPLSTSPLMVGSIPDR